MYITIGLCALVIVLFYSNYVQAYGRKHEDINRFPGPPPLPILGNILDFGIGKSKILTNLLRLSKEYGPIFRVWLGPTFASVVVTGPEYIEKILVTKSTTNKGAFYKFAEDWLGDAIVLASGEKWQKARKFIAPFFKTVNVEKLVPVFNANADKFIENLRALDLKNPLELEDPIMSLALDNICQTVLYRQCDEQFKRDFWNNFRKQSDIAFRRTFSIFKRFDVIFKLTKDYEVQKECTESGKRLIDGIVSKRKEEKKNEGDADNSKTLLDFLLDYSEHDVKYTVKNIHDEMNCILAAGSETVAMTLAFCIYELSKHPDVQRRVSEEVEAVLGDDDDVSIESVHKLDYLQCVLKEALRMYTPAPMIERTLTEDIALKDGLRIPEGTSLLIFLLGTHRSEDVYSEPDEFNPDRFLPENWPEKNQCANIPFSAGARSCLGQKYAMIESKIIMSKLVRNFEIIGVKGHEPILENQLILRSMNGLPVILRQRSRKTLNLEVPA